MKDFFAGLALVILAVSGVLGATWLFQGNDFFLQRYFAPKYEAVRRDVMIESRAYSEATTRRLYDLKRQMAQAKSEDEKATIRAMARHEVQAFDASRLPHDLRTFAEQVR